MKKEVSAIESSLKAMMKKHEGALRIRFEETGKFEMCGTKAAMQGKQQVDGFYFGSVIPKAKDCRLYFFPIYTHPEAFEGLSAVLRKYLKGKSCFHIKNLTPEVEQEIDQMISTGVALYAKDDLI